MAYRGHHMGYQQHQLPLIAERVPDHERLNTHLRDMLITMSNTVPDRVSNQSNQKSYFGNRWLSQAELHKNEDPGLQEFVRFVEKTVDQKIPRPDPGPDSDLGLSVMSMWCIVSKPGLVGVRHNHSGRISGSYYVDAGSSGAQNGGLLQFYLNRQSSQPTHQIEPESGVLYLFPSSLEHSVSVYDGATPRVVIALNLN